MKTTPAPMPEAEDVDFSTLRRLYELGEINLICVLGPTASGKTKYAVRLAKALDGEIISADSRQIYKGMDIGTGKDLADYDSVPYHIIDILPAGAQYNAFDFQQDFTKAFSDICKRGKTPILCGGTGLYISAVTGGYNWNGEKLPLSSVKDSPTLKTYFIGTLVDRDERNRRIDKRLQDRLNDGLTEEIRTLINDGVPADKLKSYGLEYKYVTEYVLGERSYEDMHKKLAIAIHQFAKRQMTWFRGMERSGVIIHWVNV